MFKFTSVLLLLLLSFWIVAPAAQAADDDWQTILGLVIVGGLIWGLSDDQPAKPHHGYLPPPPRHDCPPRWDGHPGWGPPPRHDDPWGHRPGWSAPLPPSWHGQVPPQYRDHRRDPNRAYGDRRH